MVFEMVWLYLRSSWMIMPSSGPRLCFLRSLALKMGSLGCLDVWQARRKLCLYLVLLRYSVLLAGVSAVGVRNDRILCANGEEMWGYAGRTGRLG